METKVYTTRQDVIDQVIRPALDAGEGSSESFNLEAICYDTFSWNDAAQGFVQDCAAEYFWDSVSRNEVS